LFSDSIDARVAASQPRIALAAWRRRRRRLPRPRCAPPSALDTSPCAPHTSGSSCAHPAGCTPPTAASHTRLHCARTRAGTSLKPVPAEVLRSALSDSLRATFGLAGQAAVPFRLLQWDAVAAEGVVACESEAAADKLRAAATLLTHTRAALHVTGQSSMLLSLVAETNARAFCDALLASS
jgi:hypothetical protein